MSSLEAGSPLGGERPDATLSEFDRKVAAALNNPTVFMLLLQEFKDYLVQYGVLNQPPIPVSQIFGFTQFTALNATVATTEATTSGTFTDLATVGPQLTGIPDGQYAFLFGAGVFSSVSGQQANMSLQINATTALDADAITCPVAVGNQLSLSRGITKSLDTGGNNTITAKYRTNGVATGTYSQRWLIALRYAN